MAEEGAHLMAAGKQKGHASGKGLETRYSSQGLDSGPSTWPHILIAYSAINLSTDEVRALRSYHFLKVHELAIKP